MPGSVGAVIPGQVPLLTAVRLQVDNSAAEAAVDSGPEAAAASASVSPAAAPCGASASLSHGSDEDSDRYEGRGNPDDPVAGSGDATTTAAADRGPAREALKRRRSGLDHRPPELDLQQAAVSPAKLDRSFADIAQERRMIAAEAEQICRSPEYSICMLKVYECEHPPPRQFKLLSAHLLDLLTDFTVRGARRLVVHPGVSLHQSWRRPLPKSACRLQRVCVACTRCWQ